MSRIDLMAFIRADLFIPIRYFSSSDDTNPQRTKLPKHQAENQGKYPQIGSRCLLEDDAFFLRAESLLNGVGFGRPDGGVSEEKSQKCQVCCKILFIRPNRLFEKLVITVRLKSMCPEILQQSSFIFHS